MSVLQGMTAWFDRLVGRDEASSITVPVMDGLMKPNAAIDMAPLVATVTGAEHLAALGADLLVSRGNDLLILRDGGFVPHRSYPSRITALAVSSAGKIAAGIAGHGVMITDTQGRDRMVALAGGQPLGCVTALAFLGDGSLAITNGAQDVAAQGWTRDLMLSGASGIVACLAPDAASAEVLVAGLRWPSGVCPIDNSTDRLAVSEAWAHRVIEVSRAARKIVRPIADYLPSYPSRIVALSSGGYVLTNYAVRSQLIEFILREKRYLRRMVQEVPPEYWIAPSLSSGHSFKEPLQAGGIIRLGIHKPWAPTRSYGLLIGLDPAFGTLWSAHSRADGARHGVTSVVEHGERLIALAQGNGDIFALTLNGERP